MYAYLKMQRNIQYRNLGGMQLFCRISIWNICGNLHSWQEWDRWQRQKLFKYFKEKVDYDYNRAPHSTRLQYAYGVILKNTVMKTVCTYSLYRTHGLIECLWSLRSAIYCTRIGNPTIEDRYNSRIRSNTPQPLLYYIVSILGLAWFMINDISRETSVLKFKFQWIYYLQLHIRAMVWVELASALPPWKIMT